MPSGKTRDFLRWAGSGISILAVIFVVGKLKDYGNEIDYSLFSSLAIPLIALSVAYGASNSFLAFAWRNLLRHFGISVTSHWAVRVFGVSQLAKYVPGNIFQFVDRQALGLEAGLPAWPLAKSAIWEIGVLVITGSIFIILVLPDFHVGLPFVFALVVFATTVLIAAWISNAWFSRWIAQALGWDVIFLASSGLVFVVVLSLILPTETLAGSAIIFVCGAYVVAWLAGLITPGAPAGVGIREVILFALLHPIVNEAELLTAIIFGRIVTVVGDVLFYLMALTINARTVRTV